MYSFLQALKQVSSLNIPLPGLACKTPGPWALILCKALLAFLCGAAGGLVTWLVPNDRIVAALLATATVVFLRFRLGTPEERTGIAEGAGLFCPKGPNGEMDSAYRQVFFQALLLLRPICIFILLLHHNWLWLTASAALGMAFSLDRAKPDPIGSHWISAFAVALLCGATASKVFPNQDGMFIMGLVASVVCWLFPAMLDRFEVKASRPLCFYLGESAALILGLLGQAW